MAVVTAYIVGDRITISFPRGYIYLVEKDEYEKLKKYLEQHNFEKRNDFVYTAKCEQPEVVLEEIRKHIGVIVKEFII